MTGRKISSKMAADASAELVQRRDAQIEVTNRWRIEQLADLDKQLKAEKEALRLKLVEAMETADKNYTETYTRVDGEMRVKADTVAHCISNQLAATDQMVQQRREASAANRYAQLQRLAHRLKAGVSRGLHRITMTDGQVRQRFPDWSEVLANGQSSESKVDFLPLGSLRVDESLRRLLKGETPQPDSVAAGNGAASAEELPALLADAQIPRSLPVVLHRRLHSGLVIRAPHRHIDQAIDLVHQVLWRLLAGAPPSRRS